MPDRIKEEFARSAGARELIERLPNLGTKQGAFKFLQQATQYDDVLFSNEMSDFVQAMSDKNLITPDQRKEYASFKANRAVQLASDPEKRKFFVDREFRPDLTPDQIEKYRVDKQAQLAQEAAVDRSNTKRYLGALGYTPEDVYRFGPDTSGYLNENIPLVGGAELPIMSRSFTPAEGVNQLSQSLPIAGGVVSGAFAPLGAFQDRLSGNDSGNVFNPSDSPLVAAGEAAGSEYADRIASMPGTLIGGDIGAMAGGALGARAVKGKYRGIGILLGTVLGAAGGGTVGTNINQQINENAMGHLIGAAAMAKRREAKEFNAANYSQAARIGSLAGDMTFFAPSLKVPGVGVRKAVGALSRRGTKALKNEGVRETVHDIADRATEFTQGVFESYQQSEEQKRQGLPGLTPWQILGDGAVGALLSGETKLGRAMTEPYNRLKSPEFMISNLNKLANKRAEVKADRAVRRETQLREQEGTITPTESRYRRFNLGGRLSGDVNADGQPIIKGAEYAIYDPEKRRAFIYTDNDFVLEGYRSKNAADSLTSTEFIFKRTPLIEYADKAAGVRRSILGISRDAGVVVKDIGPDGQARISTVPIADIRNEKIATRIQNVMTEHGVKPNDKPAPFMPEAYENFNKQVFDAEVTLDPSLPAFPARVVKQVNQKRQGMYIVALPDGTHMRVHESQININEPGAVVPRGQVQESELPRSLSDLIPPEKILKNQWKFGQGSEDEAVLELTPEQLTTIGKIRRKYSGDLEAIKGIRDKNQRAAAIQLNLARVAKEAESVLTFEGPAPQYKRGDVIDVNTSQFGEQTAIVIGQNKYGHIVRLVDHPRIGAFTVQPSSIKGELSRSEAESVLGGTPSATQGEYTNPDFDDEFETEAVEPTGVKEETVGAPKLERDHEKVDELELTPYTKGKLAQQLSDFLENSDISDDIRDGDFADGEVTTPDIINSEIIDEGEGTGPVALLGEKPRDVTDAGTDTGTDAGTDTGADAGADAGTETPDTGTDNQANTDIAVAEIIDELTRKFGTAKKDDKYYLDNFFLVADNSIRLDSPRSSYEKAFGYKDGKFTGRVPSHQEHLDYKSQVIRGVLEFYKSIGLGPKQAAYAAHLMHEKILPHNPQDENSLTGRALNSISWSGFNTAFLKVSDGESSSFTRKKLDETIKDYVKHRPNLSFTVDQVTPYFQDSLNIAVDIFKSVYPEVKFGNSYTATESLPDVGAVFMAKRPSFTGRAANRTKDGFIVTVKNTVMNVMINRDDAGDVRVRMEMTQYDPGKKNIVGQAVTEYTAKRQSGGEWHVFNTVYGDQRDASAFFTVKGSDRDFMRNLVRGMVNHSIGMKNSDPNWKSATDIAVEQSPEAQRKASDIAARKAQAEAKRAEAEANKEKQRQANKEKWQAELALREKLAQQAAELKREELRVKQKTAETSAEVTDLKDKLEKLQAEIGASAQQASDDLKAVKDQLTDVTDRLRKAKKKAKDAKNDAEKRQAEAIEKALEAQAKKHSDDMAALQRIVDGVQNADKLATSQLEKKIEQLVNQIIEQQKELAGRSVQLSTDTTDNDARIAALLAQMKMIESQYDAKIEELNNQIAELNKQLSGVGASVEKPKRVKKETVYKESEIDSIVQNREIITVLKEINGTQYKLDATIVNNRTQLKTVLHEQYGYTKTGAHYWSGVVDHFARAWAARQLAARQRTLDYRDAQRTTSEGEIENIMHRVLRRDEETVKSLAMLMREFYRDRFAAFAYVPELSKLDDIGYGATFTAAREDGTSFNVITAFASRDEETGVHEIAHALLRGMDPKYRKKILGQMQSLRMSGSDFSEAMPVDAEELFVGMFISSLRNKVVPVVQGKFPSGDAREESRDLELFWNGTGKYLNEILATVTEKNIKDQAGNTLTQWVAPFDSTMRLFKGMQVYINRDGGPNDELAVVVKSDPKDKATYDKYRQVYAPEGKVEVHIAGEKNPVLIDRGQITNMGGLTQGFNPGMLETLSKYLGAWYRESDFAMWKSVKHLMEDFNDTLVPSTGTSDPFNTATDETSDTGTDTGTGEGTDTGTGTGTSTGGGTDTGNKYDGSKFAKARQIYGTDRGPESGPVIFYSSGYHESAKKEILKLFPNAIETGFDGRITDAYIHSKTGMPYHKIPFKTFSIGKGFRNDKYKNGPDRYIGFPELNRNRNVYSFGRDIRDVSPEALQAIRQQINSTYDETIEGIMRTFISKGTQVSRSNEGIPYGLHEYHSTLSVLEELSSFLNDQKLLTALGQPDAYHLLKYGKLDSVSKEFIYGRIFMNQGVDGLVRLANLALARPMVDSLFKYEGLQPIANLSWLFDHDKKTGPLSEYLKDAANYVIDPSTGLNDKDFLASDTFDYAPILAMHTADSSRAKDILSKMELSSDKRSRINDSTLEAMARGLDAFYFYGDPFDNVEDPFKFAFNAAVANYSELNKYERALLTGSDVDGLNSRQSKSKMMAYLALNYMSGMAKSIPTYTDGNYRPDVYISYTKIGTTDLIKTQMYLDAVNSELKEGIVDIFRHNNNEGSRLFKPVDIDIYDGVMVFDRVKAQQSYPAGSFRVNIRTGETMFKPVGSYIWSEYRAKAKVYNPDNVLPFKERVNNNRSMLYPRRSWVTGMMLAQLNNKHRQVRQVNVPDIALSAKMPKIKFTEAERSAKVPVNSPEVKAELKPIIESMVKSGRFDGNTAYDSRGKVSNLHNLYQNAAGLSSGAALLNYARTETKSFKQWSGNNPVVEAIFTHDMRPSVTVGEVSPAVRTNIRKYMAGKSIVKFVKSLNGILTPEDAVELEVLMDDYLRGESKITEIREAIDAAIDDSTELQALLETVTEQLASTKFEVARVHLADADIYADASTRPRTGRPLVTVGFAPNKTLAWLRSARGYVLSSGPSDQTGYNKYGYYLRVDNPLVVDLDGQGIDAVSVEKMMAKNPSRDGIVFLNAKHSIGGLNTTHNIIIPRSEHAQLPWTTWTDTKPGAKVYPSEFDYILRDKSQDEWMNNFDDQEISSADTSIKQVPSLFKSKVFVPNGDNLDIGGGKFDEATKYLKAVHGVDNYVHDIYNRSAAHNASVEKHFSGNPPKTVTIANVLNVIKDRKHRDLVLRQAYSALGPGGKVYISVYEGNRTGVPAQTSKGWQNNSKPEFYMDEIKSVFPDAKLQNGVVVATKPLNDNIAFMGRMPDINYKPDYDGRAEPAAPSMPSAETPMRVRKTRVPDTADKLTSVVDFINDVTRLTLSSDLAFMTLQAGIISLSNPAIGFRAFLMAMRGFAPNLKVEWFGGIGHRKLGREVFHDIGDTMRQHPAYDLAREAGLPLQMFEIDARFKEALEIELHNLRRINPDATIEDCRTTLMDIDELGTNDEWFIKNRLSRHLPMQGQFERFNTILHDQILLLAFDNWHKQFLAMGYVEGSEKMKRALKDGARILAVTTGDVAYSTNQQRDATAGRIAKLLFTAPRWVMSRALIDPWINSVLSGDSFSLLHDLMGHDNPIWNLYKGDQAAAALGRTMYGRLVGGQILMMILAILWQNFNPETEVETDVTRQAGRIRVGDFRIDPPAGLFDHYRLGYRLLEAALQTNPADAKKAGREGGTILEKIAQDLGREVSYKSSPMLNMAVGLFQTGKTPIGEPMFAENEAATHVYNKLILPRLIEINGGIQPWMTDVRVSNAFLERFPTAVSQFVESYYAADKYGANPELYASLNTGLNFIGLKTEIKPVEALKERKRNVAQYSDTDTPTVGSVIEEQGLIGLFKGAK